MKSGFRRTLTGRIVYDRPEHPFTPKDVQRIMFAINNEVIERGIRGIPGFLESSHLYRQRYALPFRNIHLLSSQWYEFWIQETWDTLSLYEQLKRSGQYEVFKKQWLESTNDMFDKIIDLFDEDSPVRKVAPFVKWLFENAFANRLFEIFVRWEG